MRGFGGKQKKKIGWLGVSVTLICLLLGCAGDRKEETIHPEDSLADETVYRGEPLAEGTIYPEDPLADETVYRGESLEGKIPESPADQMPEVPEPDTSYDFTLCFAGDINLSENWYIAPYLDTCENGVYDCFDEIMMEHMQGADYMILNNEYTYSQKGEPTKGKRYTFRANPDRVEVLKNMGVDAVSLANNHTHDYGVESLLDTLDTLDGAGIERVGAGRTLEEAMEPLYFELDGKVIALVAASRAEKYKMTPQATETEPGILRCYDTELFMQEIQTARENADFVVAFVHWGTEESYVLEDVQLTTGKEYLDAGVDAVIGGHSHCLQGMEYYDGKPIVYSLGNYWFNNKELDTMLVELHFYGDDQEQNLEMKVVPAIQKNCQIRYAGEEDGNRIYRFLESISINIEIDEDGIVREKMR